MDINASLMAFINGYEWVPWLTSPLVMTSLQSASVKLTHWKLV